MLQTIYLRTQQNLCLHNSFINNTVEPVYYEYFGTIQKCPDYQGVLIFQVSLHDNVYI